MSACISHRYFKFVTMWRNQTFNHILFLTGADRNSSVSHSFMNFQCLMCLRVIHRVLATRGAGKIDVNRYQQELFQPIQFLLHEDDDGREKKKLPLFHLMHWTVMEQCQNIQVFATTVNTCQWWCLLDSKKDSKRAGGKSARKDRFAQISF